MPSRKKRSSGRLSPPVDVNSTDKIGKFESLTGAPILVFVYADWCGHCQRYKPIWKKLTQDPNRSINMAALRDDMLPQTSLSQRAEPVSSYPTVLLLGKNGKAVNFKTASGVSQEVPDHGNLENMTAIVRNAGNDNGQTALEEASASISMLPNRNISRNNRYHMNLNSKNISWNNKNRNRNHMNLNSKNISWNNKNRNRNVSRNNRNNTMINNLANSTAAIPLQENIVPPSQTVSKNIPNMPYRNESQLESMVASSSGTTPSWQPTSPPDPAADVVRTREPQAGGSLYDFLARSAYGAVVPGLLVTAASLVDRKERQGRKERRKGRKTRKTSKN